MRGQTRGFSWFWNHCKHLFCKKNTCKSLFVIRSVLWIAMILNTKSWNVYVPFPCPCITTIWQFRKNPLLATQSIDSHLGSDYECCHIKVLSHHRLKYTSNPDWHKKSKLIVFYASLVVRIGSEDENVCVLYYLLSNLAFSPEKIN